MANYNMKEALRVVQHKTTTAANRTSNQNEFQASSYLGEVNPQGTYTIPDEWDAGTTYVEGDLVSWNGYIYMADDFPDNLNEEPSLTSEFWLQVGVDDYDGGVTPGNTGGVYTRYWHMGDPIASAPNGL